MDIWTPRVIREGTLDRGMTVGILEVLPDEATEDAATAAAIKAMESDPTIIGYTLKRKQALRNQ